MPHNNFNDVDGAATIIAVTAGAWGAILSFLRRDLREFSMYKKLTFFITDMFINVGITLLVYLGLIGYGINDVLSVAIGGFIGHQGTRSFYLIELIITEKLGAKDTFNTIRKDI